MRGLTLALAATTAFASMAAAEGLVAFRLLELKGSSVKWGTPTLGTGATVTYAFADRPMQFSDARNCRAMVPMDGLLANSGIDRSLFEAEVVKAFATWSAVADVQFRRTDDTTAADIIIGAQANPLGRAFTNVAYEQSADSEIRPIDKSLICLNPDQPWKVGFDGNLDVYDLRYTIAHEIGHAIGLDHPSSTGQVMSYRYDEKFDSLQVGDVRGAISLYGQVRLIAKKKLGVQTVSGGGKGQSTGSAVRDHQTRALP